MYLNYLNRFGGHFQLEQYWPVLLLPIQFYFKARPFYFSPFVNITSGGITIFENSAEINNSPKKEVYKSSAKKV
jgi:hypothetical protein